MSREDERKAAAAEREREAAARPMAGTVLGRTGGRPDYVGIQHPMRQAGGPKARTLPGLGAVMKDLAYRGGAGPEPEEEKPEAAAAGVREYNRTHRQSAGSDARRRITGEAARMEAQEARAAAAKPNSIGDRSMQLQDKSPRGKAPPKPDRELPGQAGGRSIEAVDALGGGKGGRAGLLEAKARELAKKKKQG